VQRLAAGAGRGSFKSTLFAESQLPPALWHVRQNQVESCGPRGYHRSSPPLSSNSILPLSLILSPFNMCRAGREGPSPTPSATLVDPCSAAELPRRRQRYVKNKIEYHPRPTCPRGIPAYSTCCRRPRAELPSLLCPREQNVLLLRYPPDVSTFPVRPVPTLWRRVGGVQASYGPVYEGDSLLSMLRKSTIAALH
jgi:hypothetical protein